MSDWAKLLKTGGDQTGRLPKKCRPHGRSEVRIHSEGGRVSLKSAKRGWSRRFLKLAGSARDFPYSAEPKSADPGLRLD